MGFVIVYVAAWVCTLDPFQLVSSESDPLQMDALYRTVLRGSDVHRWICMYMYSTVQYIPDGQAMKR